MLVDEYKVDKLKFYNTKGRPPIVAHIVIMMNSKMSFTNNMRNNCQNNQEKYTLCSLYFSTNHQYYLLYYKIIKGSIKYGGSEQQ